MIENITIKELTEQVETASTDFERTNTDLKRKYLIWNIEAFKIIASAVRVGKGAFGTGYPFYALDENLKGTLPIIQEQIRYNRQLVKDGEVVQKSIWLCKSCIDRNHLDMKDLKGVCRSCPNVLKELKPRKVINRLPDFDMWLICEDGCIAQAQEELDRLLKEYSITTSDIEPIKTIEDIYRISAMLKEGKFPKIYLPIDAHIMEYSKMRELIEQVPVVLRDSKLREIKPYLPIMPKSYRKEWRYDNEAYNFIYDYLSAFTPFNFPQELQECLNKSRARVSRENSPEELFGFLMQSATDANFRRFQTVELEENFIKRVTNWQHLKEGQDFPSNFGRSQMVIDDETSR